MIKIKNIHLMCRLPVMHIVILWILTVVIQEVCMIQGYFEGPAFIGGIFRVRFYKVSMFTLIIGQFHSTLWPIVVTRTCVKS